VKRASNAVCLSIRLKRRQRDAFASFRLAPSFVTSLGMSVEAQRFSENDIEHSPPADLTAGSSLGYRLKIPRAITKLVDAYRPPAEPGVAMALAQGAERGRSEDCCRTCAWRGCATL
jgi:hypothetical protein